MRPCFACNETSSRACQTWSRASRARASRARRAGLSQSVSQLLQLSQLSLRQETPYAKRDLRQSFHSSVPYPLPYPHTGTFHGWKWRSSMEMRARSAWRSVRRCHVKSAPMLELSVQRMEGRPILVFGDGRHWPRHAVCSSRLLQGGDGDRDTTELFGEDAPGPNCNGHGHGAAPLVRPVIGLRGHRRGRLRLHGAAPTFEATLPGGIYELLGLQRG